MVIEWQKCLRLLEFYNLDGSWYMILILSKSQMYYAMISEGLKYLQFIEFVY